MKRILFLTPFSPLPLSGGGSKCMYFRIKTISQKIWTDLVSADSTDIKCDEKSIEYYFPEVKNYILFPRYANEMKKISLPCKFLEMWKWLTSKRPRLVQKNTDANKKGKIKNLILKEKITHICLEQPYLWDLLDRDFLKMNNIKTVYIAHNIELLYWQDLGYFNQNSIFSKIEYKRMKSFEKEVVNNSDLVIGISPKDVEYMKKNMHPKKIFYLPTNLDIEKVSWKNKNSDYICFTGSLSFYPNYHGIKWFLENVFIKYNKLYPNIKLKITGKVSDKIKQDLNGYPNLVFTGFLSNEELENLMLNCLFSVVPIIKGSGVKIKLLEALSYGIPVVTTQHGANGVPYENEEPYFIGESEKEFLNKMIDLTKDNQKRKFIGNNAKKFVEKTYISDTNTKKWIESILNLD